MMHAISPIAARAIGTSLRVDIAIVTIRDDEFRAVLAAFPDKAGTLQGASRAYTLRHADAGDGERYRIAVLRLIEQGQGEAQDAARDLIDDLEPRLGLVVGIAGGRPSADVKLGSVVVSTRIHDFTRAFLRTRPVELTSAASGAAETSHTASYRGPFAGEASASRLFTHPGERHDP